MTRAVDRLLAPRLPWVTIKPKKNNLNFNLQLRAQCFRAYVLGDLRSAIEVFHHHAMSAAADGLSESAALKIARAKSASGVSSAGIGGVGFLIFWGIDARLIAGRWPSTAMAWLRPCCLSGTTTSSADATTDGWRGTASAATR